MHTSSSHSSCRAPSRYYFGCAEFCPETLELSVLGEVLALERRPLRLLHVLLQHADRVVPHEELLRVVWGGRVTVKNVLPNAMTKLRKALGRDAKLIVTIPGVGYRLNGPVRFDDTESMAAELAAGAAAPGTMQLSHELDLLSICVAAPGSDRLAAFTEPPAEGSPGRAQGDPADMLGAMPLKRRLDAFQQFAEAVGRRHAIGTGYSGISRIDVNAFADGRLVLLAHRPRDSSMSSVPGWNDPYKAPELYRGEEGNERSDIYALGVLLYQLCCADIHRPLLPDWFMDVADERSRMLIEEATRTDPWRRPSSVAQWLALPELEADEDAPATAWQRIFGLPVRLSRRSRL